MVLLYCKKAKLGNGAFSFILQVEPYNWDFTIRIPSSFLLSVLSHHGYANNVVVADHLGEGFFPY